MHLGAHDVHCQTAYPNELYHCHECYDPVLGLDLIGGVCSNCRRKAAEAAEKPIYI